jgi:hypothetical protein
VTLTFDQRSDVVASAERVRGLYEELCLHLNDRDVRERIWSLIRNETDEIEALLSYTVRSS